MTYEEKAAKLRSAAEHFRRAGTAYRAGLTHLVELQPVSQVELPDVRALCAVYASLEGAAVATELALELLAKPASVAEAVLQQVQP